MFSRILLLIFTVSLCGGGIIDDSKKVPSNCKKYLDGVFVYDPRNPDDFVARTDTSIIEVFGGEKPHMVKYNVRWEKNGCDHDLLYVRTTPPEMETVFKKGDVVHIKVKEAGPKYVSFTASFKSKIQQTGMYRIE
jgi:hypothetical protein